MQNGSWLTISQEAAPFYSCLRTEALCQTSSSLSTGFQLGEGASLFTICLVLFLASTDTWWKYGAVTVTSRLFRTIQGSWARVCRRQGPSEVGIRDDLLIRIGADLQGQTPLLEG